MNITGDEVNICNHLCDISLGPMEAKHNTIELCKDVFLNGIEGDLAEAGVFAGTHPILMSYMARKFGKDIKVHMIDSFMGIPKVLDTEHPHDQHVYGLRKVGEPITSSGISNCSLEGVKGYVGQFGGDPTRMVYHPGWFQDTLPTIEIDKLAILRLDVDLVESLECCFKYLYPKISKGGWIIIDDYYSPTCKVLIDNFMKEHDITDSTVIGPEKSIIYWKVK